MNGLDEETIAPQNFLYGCKLEAGKEVVFNPEDDDFEHQLEMKMACVDASTSDELHMVEVEGQDEEGQKVKAVLASLKPSTLPSVCLGGFTITPPAVFRLKAGSGPIHISGQHLVMMGGDQSFDEEEEEEEEEEEVKTSKKRPASSPAPKSQKKMKKEDDVEEDDEEEDDEEEEEEEEEESSPVQAKPVAKPKTPAQNGKSSKPNTPSKQAKTPQTPKKPLTVEEIKQKMMEALKKGVALPKAQPKFENMVKNGYKTSDSKIIADLWKWRQTTMKESQ